MKEEKLIIMALLETLIDLNGTEVYITNDIGDEYSIEYIKEVVEKNA